MSDSAAIEPDKLKVVELRAELSARSLDARGNKAALVKRLKQALRSESNSQTSTASDAGHEGHSDAADDESNDGDPSFSMDTSQNSKTEDLEQQDDSNVDDAAVKEEAEEEERLTNESNSNENEEAVKSVPLAAQEDDHPVEDDKMVVDTTQNEHETKVEIKQEKDEEDSEKPDPEESAAAANAGDGDAAGGDGEKVEQDIKKEPVETDSTIKQEPSDDTGPGGDHYRGEKRRRSSRSPSWDRKRSRSYSDNVKRGRRHSRSRSRSRSRRGHSRSRSRDNERKRYSPDIRSPAREPEEDFDDTIVALDTYNSDLHLNIHKSRYSAKPYTDEGFAFMWSGIRATYGFRKGKICFEVKVMEHMDVSHLPSDEPNPHVVRVGASTEETSMQLGEELWSYGYGGTGKISTNCQFKDFGSEFMAGDVIGCFLNLENDPIEISYTKNGDPLGIAFRISQEQLGERALFPHVLTKNCSFEINFGQLETPFFPLPETLSDYMFASCVPLEERLRGTKAPEKREDCEMLMMCGLPGAGKTTWADEYVTKHPEKKYYILGTNHIIDKMKVMGLPRKRNYAGRWDVLIKMSTKCLNKLLEVGTKVKRNFILDQTNVYASAQRRKMRPFEGYKRRAVVLVPSDEEFKSRVNKRETEEGKDVPESAVLEMKANFTLPEVGNIFDAIEFVELPLEEATVLVEQYRKEGLAALPPQDKRFFRNDRGGGNRGGSRFGPPHRDNRDNRDRGRVDDRRYGNQSGRYGNQSGGGRGGGFGGYRDNRSFNRGSMGGPGQRGGPNRNGPNRNGPPPGMRDNRGGGGYRDRNQPKHEQGHGYGRGGYGQGGSYNQGYGSHQTYNYSQNPGYGTQQSWKQPQGYSQPASGYGQQPTAGYGAQQQPQQQNYNWNQQYYSQPQWGQPAGQAAAPAQAQPVQPQTQPYAYNQQYYNQYYGQGQQAYGGSTTTTTQK